MSGFKIDMELASTGLVELADERLKGGFMFRAELSDPGPRALRLDDLKLKTGKTSLTGKLHVDFGAKVPAVKAELKAGTLDLEPFIGSGGQGKKAPPSKGGQTCGKGQKPLRPGQARRKGIRGPAGVSRQKAGSEAPA